ncbi:hypothetical protein PS6_011578, partial [Mucor atramentarius]
SQGNKGSFKSIPKEREVSGDAQAPPDISDVRGFAVPISVIEQCFQQMANRFEKCF